MSDPIPWQPPPDGMETNDGPMLIPQELYDHLMALPPGTDVSEFFEFEPGWNLSVTTKPPRAQPSPEDSP